MATDLTGLDGKISASINLTGEKELDLSIPQDPFAKRIAESLSFGSADDQVDQLWHDQRILAASTPEELDLLDGLLNAFGVSCVFATIKAFLIHNVSVNACTLEIGGAAVTPAPIFFKDNTDIIVLPPGASFLAIAPKTGWTVSPGANAFVKINNITAQEAKYEIAIVGTNT